MWRWFNFFPYFLLPFIISCCRMSISLLLSECISSVRFLLLSFSISISLSTYHPNIQTITNFKLPCLLITKNTYPWRISNQKNNKKSNNNKNRIKSMLVHFINHQVKNGSKLGLISWAVTPESGYSSKFDTSPRLFTTGT